MDLLLHPAVTALDEYLFIYFFLQKNIKDDAQVAVQDVFGY